MNSMKKTYYLFYNILPHLFFIVFLPVSEELCLNVEKFSTV